MGRGRGRGRAVGVGVGMPFFPFFGFNFCPYSPVMLFSNDRHTSVLHLWLKLDKNIKGTYGSYESRLVFFLEIGLCWFLRESHLVFQKIGLCFSKLR